MIAPLLDVERAAKILGVESQDVLDLLGRGELHGLEVAPGIVRVRPADLQRFIRARRMTFALPAVTIHVGTWSLPSGHHVDIWIGPAVEGVRRLRVFHDALDGLTDEDRRALDEKILPAASARIPKLTGRPGGWGVVAVPEPPASELGEQV